MGGALAWAGAPAVAAWHVEGPPAGHTGGFGEPTCQACHTEYELNLAGGRLSLEGWPGTYLPGETYTLSVVLDAPDMTLAGFQLSVRDESGAQAGELRPVDTRVAVADSQGVSYAQHAAAGTDVTDGRTAVWTLSWVAPAHGNPVRAHVAANSANGDNSPFGDLIYVASWAATAGTPSRPSRTRR